MTNHNAANERMKREYFVYLAEALGQSEQTVDAVAKAVARFEAYTRYKDFKAFHVEQAKASWLGRNPAHLEKRRFRC